MKIMVCAKLAEGTSRRCDPEPAGKLKRDLGV